MKQSYLTLLLALASFLFSSTINAQAENEGPKTPQWVSDKGYWNVESNKKTPRNCIVYFYNNENILVYKEEIKNRKLKLNRKKNLLRLKAALEEAVGRYEKGTWAHQDNLVIQHLQ